MPCFYSVSCSKHYRTLCILYQGLAGTLAAVCPLQALLLITFQCLFRKKVIPSNLTLYLNILSAVMSHFFNYINLVCVQVPL